MIALAALALLASVPPAAACGDCDDPLIDAEEAHAASMRECRDPVEGFWLVYLDWTPGGIARSYRIAIVKNTYGIYPEADYLGVATCDSPGCRKGEVKLTLKSAFKSGGYEAEFFVTDGITASGTAILTEDKERGRENCVLDTRGVKYKDKIPTVEIIRIIGG